MAERTEVKVLDYDIFPCPNGLFLLTWDITALFSVIFSGNDPMTTGREGMNAVDDLGVNRVPPAVGYIWECREHIEGQVPRPWTQAKVSRRSSVTVSGLVPGREYAFRVRALGPNEVESAWSDEAVSRAA